MLVCWMVQDYWHHWEDVCAGFLLGITVAYTVYRQQFPPLTDARAGTPLQQHLEGMCACTANMQGSFIMQAWLTGP